MKTLALIVLLFSSVAIVRGEGTNAPPTNTVGTVTQSLITELPKPSPTTTIITPVEPKPDQMTVGKAEVAGIFVEAAKTRPRWKLINPFSPPANSSVEDNVNRDITTGKVNGLKLFAVKF
jgi:hypothetical protein